MDALVATEPHGLVRVIHVAEAWSLFVLGGPLWAYNVYTVMRVFADVYGADSKGALKPFELLVVFAIMCRITLYVFQYFDVLKLFRRISSLRESAWHPAATTPQLVDSFLQLISSPLFQRCEHFRHFWTSFMVFILGLNSYSAFYPIGYRYDLHYVVQFNFWCTVFFMALSLSCWLVIDGKTNVPLNSGSMCFSLLILSVFSSQIFGALGLLYYQLWLVFIYFYVVIARPVYRSCLRMRRLPPAQDAAGAVSASALQTGSRLLESIVGWSYPGSSLLARVAARLLQPHMQRHQAADAFLYAGDEDDSDAEGVEEGQEGVENGQEGVENGQEGVENGQEGVEEGKVEETHNAPVAVDGRVDQNMDGATGTDDNPGDEPTSTTQEHFDCEPNATEPEAAASAETKAVGDVVVDGGDTDSPLLAPPGCVGSSSGGFTAPPLLEPRPGMQAWVRATAEELARTASGVQRLFLQGDVDRDAQRVVWGLRGQFGPQLDGVTVDELGGEGDVVSVEWLDHYSGLLVCPVVCPCLFGQVAQRISSQLHQSASCVACGRPHTHPTCTHTECRQGWVWCMIQFAKERLATHGRGGLAFLPAAPCTTHSGGSTTTTTTTKPGHSDDQDHIPGDIDGEAHLAYLGVVYALVRRAQCLIGRGAVGERLTPAVMTRSELSITGGGPIVVLPADNVVAATEVSCARLQFSLPEQKSESPAPPQVQHIAQGALSRTLRNALSLALYQPSSGSIDAPNDVLEALAACHRDCPICLDGFHPTALVRVLRCGHAFHADCIDSWMGQQFRCPLCREYPCPRPAVWHPFHPRRIRAFLRRPLQLLLVLAVVMLQLWNPPLPGWLAPNALQCAVLPERYTALGLMDALDAPLDEYLSVDHLTGYLERGNLHTKEFGGELKSLLSAVLVHKPGDSSANPRHPGRPYAFGPQHTYPHPAKLVNTPRGIAGMLCRYTVMAVSFLSETLRGTFNCMPQAPLLAEAGPRPLSEAEILEFRRRGGAMNATSAEMTVLLSTAAQTVTASNFPTASPKHLPTPDTGYGFHWMLLVIGFASFFIRSI